MLAKARLWTSDQFADHGVRPWEATRMDLGAAWPTGDRRPARTSLADSVYDILLARLMEGSPEPGEPLNIDGLARTLEVSPTPIREALARLESTGLVTRAALKGYRVAPLFTAREIDDLMDARAVIEPVNARLATRRMTSGVLSKLAVTIDELSESPRGPGFTEIRDYWAADERFHNIIAEHADNEFLLGAYRALGGHVQRFRLFGGLGVTDADAAIAEHTSILAAIEASDADAAQHAMAEHIGSVKTRARHDRQARL